MFILGDCFPLNVAAFYQMKYKNLKENAFFKIREVSKFEFA